MAKTLQKVLAWGLGGATAGTLLAQYADRKLRYGYTPTGYGPRWGSRRPPGLPKRVRKASRYGAAVAAIEAWAKDQNMEQAFAEAAVRLAKNESGARFGLPANNFDARCTCGVQSARDCTMVDGCDPNSGVITAWGVFQYNRDAWRSETGDLSFPWDASAAQEVEIPLARYATLWHNAKRAGGNDLDAERAIRLWHMSPGNARAFIDRLEQSPRYAWNQVPAKYRTILDQKVG